MTISEKSDMVSLHHYTKPLVKGKKEHVALGKTPYGVLKVQALNKGGENNLHSHPRVDGYWYVLKGGVRFYTTDDVLVAELRENEGFVTPRGYKYWFEAVPGDVDLELLEFHAATVPLNEKRAEDGRINHEARKMGQGKLDQEVHPLEDKN